jgi:hypothetical protein
MRATATLTLTAFVGGLFAALFDSYQLRRYGLPDSDFADSPLLQEDLRLFVIGWLLLLGGALACHRTLSSVTWFKKLGDSVHLTAAVSIVLSTTVLASIPLMRFIGPWDYAAIFIYPIGLCLFIFLSLFFSAASLYMSTEQFYPLVSLAWCSCVIAIVLMRFLGQPI